MTDQFWYVVHFGGSFLISNFFQGKVVVIRGEGPKGGPGMPEMLTPTSAIMGAGLGKVFWLNYYAYVTTEMFTHILFDFIQNTR